MKLNADSGLLLSCLTTCHKMIAKVCHEILEISYGLHIRFSSKWMASALFSNVYFGRHPAAVPDGSVIFFPCVANFLCCGLSGIVSFKPRKTDHSDCCGGVYRLMASETHCWLWNPAGMRPAKNRP